MHRSQSTSSVFIDALYQVNPAVNPGSNDRDFNNVNYRSPSSELYEPEVRSREPEIRGATMSTLTSALTGSKMATTVQLPTSAGNRPLPKALLPKAARSPASPPVIGGTVFGRTPPKPSDVRRGSFSYTPSNTLAKPHTPAPDGWVGTSRPHSASVSSAFHLRNSLSSAAPDDPSPTPPPPPPLERGTTSGHVTRPVVLRRREPVVEESIYPLLKAALGKDRERENRRTEDEIARQVFGRSSRIFSSGVSPSSSSSPALPSTPVLSPRNIYSSVDDVFVSSSSAEGMTSPRTGTLSHNHAKSSSEVIASSLNRLEFLPRHPWRQITTTMAKEGSGAGPHSLRHSIGREEDASSNRSREPDYIVASGSFSSRPPPLPPNSPPPPPDFTDSTPGADRHLCRVVSCENLCRSPISAEPRKVIRNPWRHAPHPTNSPQPLYGKLLQADSFPLLAKVDRHLLDGESEFVDSAAPASSRSSKIQNTGIADLDLQRGQRRRQTIVPSKSIDSAMDDSFLPPPIGFRDNTTTNPPSPARATIVNGAHFHVRHQATDSVNTEDSGLDRWEKEEEEEEEDAQDDPPSADEMHDAASDRTTTAAAAAADETGSPSTAEGQRGGGGGGHWREDQSEGRGSLTSSPRPLSAADYTVSLSSAKEEEDASYSGKRPLDLIGNESPSGERNLVDDRLVASNGILSQLLAENSTSYRQAPHNIYHRSGHHHHHHHHRLDDAERVKRSGGGGEAFAPRYARLPSSDLDSEDSNSFSTTVQPSVAASEDTLDRISAERAAGCLRSTAEQDSADGDSSVYFQTTDLQRDLETAEPWKRRSWFGESGKQRPEEQTGMKDGADGGGDRVVDIVKGPVGIGFCIEGGRGSLSGDRPILVKRLFKGGLADGLVDLRPGDELVSVGGQSLEGFSHYDAWKFIKALPNGIVQMTIRRT